MMGNVVAGNVFSLLQKSSVMGVAKMMGYVVAPVGASWRALGDVVLDLYFGVPLVVWK